MHTSTPDEIARTVGVDEWWGSASQDDWTAFGDNDHPHYIVGPAGVYRLHNGVQSYLGPLKTGGASALLWIGGGALAVGGGGAALYCRIHGC